MSKKLIIFGNGLGMALDSNHFLLTNAMSRVWGCPDRFEDEDREIIGSLKNIDSETGPQNEDQLSSTQQALSYLSSFRAELGEDALNQWFRDSALTYPEKLNKYIFEVAYELYNYKIPEERQEVWNDFLTSLIKFVAETRSHIATLNYDDLLYAPFIDGHQIDGRQFKLSSRTQNNGGAPYIRDGFMNGEYNSSTFGYTGNCGMYLHLHGSPLYISDQENVKKLNRSEIAGSDRDLPRHIVLANRDDKQTIIRRSAVLKDYWEERLPTCIDEADEIMLFGYSGNDDHLNKLIKEKHSGPISVIEWFGAQHFNTSNDGSEGAELTSKVFWEAELDRECHIVRLVDILDFRDWADPENYIPF